MMETKNNSKKLSRPHDALYLIRIVMSTLGILPPLNTTKWDRLYVCYIILQLFVFSILFILTQFINLFYISGVEQIADSSYLMIQHMSLCFKATFLVKNWKKIRRIYDLLKSPTFTSHRLDQEEIVQESMYIVRRNCNVYYGFSILLVFVTFILPLLVGIVELPYVGWYPFDLNVTANFVMVYLWQAMGIVVCAYMNASIDMFTTGIMELTVGQMNVLSNSLETIRETAVKRIYNGLSTDENQQDSQVFGPQNRTYKNTTKINTSSNDLKERDPVLENAIYKEVVGCIQHQYEIYSLIELIKSTFLNMAFVQFAGSVIVLCVTTFEISLMSIDNPAIFGIINFQILMLQQLLLYCWYGNEIYLASISVFDAAYASKWNESGTKVRRAIGLIMERAKRPILLSAGNFIPLTLDTYISILKLSYSFYTVLQKARIN